MMQMATGMMDSTDIEAVATLAKMVPKGGIVVDIGSLLGMSASLWCIHSAASRIVCIDLWKYEPWLESFAKANGEITKEAFLRNVPDDRIEAIQGPSPGCVSKWWNTRIDLFWEDADHANPGFERNLRFWSRQVKNGGIVCGHDYHWPDVSREAGLLAEIWGSKVQRLGTSVWWIRKPENLIEQKPGALEPFTDFLTDKGAMQHLHRYRKVAAHNLRKFHPDNLAKSRKLRWLKDRVKRLAGRGS